jgi:hypothetical protein
MSTRAFVSGRPPRQNRRLCDGLGAIQAALLMAGRDPSSDAGYIEGYVWFKLREIARTPDIGDTFRPSTDICRVARKGRHRISARCDGGGSGPSVYRRQIGDLVTLPPSVPASGESLTPENALNADTAAVI